MPSRLKLLISFSMVLIMLIGVILPSASAFNIDHMAGFDKGPSYKSVVPMEKVTFVNYDEESILDDYAYLAAVPTAVFNDKDKLFSNPLLFYQDEYLMREDKERSLNARQGIDYFMEDWMEYCNGQLDQMTLINVPKEKVGQWRAKDYTIIEGDDPYTIASDIALHDWSYSDNAVIAVIDEQFDESSIEFQGKIGDTFSINKHIKTEQFTVPQTNKLNPQFREFNVPEGYMYIQARAWYSCVYFDIGLPVPGFENFMTVTIPSGDKDLQLYCLYENDWMQVEAASGWNAKEGMDKDYARSYIYKSGPWRVGITDIPTKGFGRYGLWKDVISNIAKGVEYKADIEMYPGIKIPFNVSIPFYCSDIAFNLDCKNSNINFEFLLIGPSGDEIASSENGTIKIDKLGECLPGENYEFVIYTKDDKVGSFNYEITYSWHQNKLKYEADCLTDATEGAVLASVLNAPLLYTSKSELPEETANVLYKLGVENIYVVNIGGHLSKEIENKLNEIVRITKNYKDHKGIYDDIREISGNNDVIFSTIDPWTHWYIEGLEPAGEDEGALFLGPAAYIAAHHGSPVLIVDNHPELSSAATWHTHSWRKQSDGYNNPTVSEMYLTGTRVYAFLDDQGFEQKGMETIITVAGQYDIGASWDRMFVGRATPGRFAFSPVDTAYWISRNMFYPALIFVNPAMNPSGIELINGSISERGPLGRLKVVRESGPENFKYPVLQSYVSSYIHRFNERASKYWGAPYQCADGIIPGIENTFEPIDDGVNLKHKGESGSFWPDITESENVPFYMSRCGYSNAFSTSFEPIMDNLNSGCIMWVMGSHGWSYNSGEFTFHNPNFILRGNKEPNPWRGYEFYLGSTEEPDTMTTEIHGIIPALLGNPNKDGIFRTAIDIAPAKKPLLDLIGNFLSRPALNKLTPRLGWLKDTEDYYDGIVGSALFSKIGTVSYNGYDIDDALDNIYSCGLITAACLPAYKYLHLTMVRHGCSFQVIDPWGTSWYSSFWEATIPRDIALGDTIGEAFVKGISHVGILYITEPPQWWWDLGENVCYFGDPDLRVFTPSTKYSDKNYWGKENTKALRYDEEIDIGGHMPYGTADYPHEKEPGFKIPPWIILMIVIILVIIVAVAGLARKKFMIKYK